MEDGQAAHLREDDENYLVTPAATWGPAALPSLIALANDALKDDDKRKITREWVNTLRAEWHDTNCGALYALYDHECDCDERPARKLLLSIAVALESYLPPE